MTKMPTPTLVALPTRRCRSHLHDRFVDRATAEGLVDVAYRTVDTRIGELLLAASPTGLVRVAFALEDFDTVLAELADRDQPARPAACRVPLDDAARQIDAYLSGQLEHFDLAIDLQLVRGFRRDVLQHLCTVPYGTHGELHRRGASCRPAGRGTRRGECVFAQPDPVGGPLPPGRAQRRHLRPVPRRSRDQARPAGDGAPLTAA